MLRWADNHLLDLKWEEIGEHYGRYRLHVPEAERAYRRSSCAGAQDRYELIDRFQTN